MGFSYPVGRRISTTERDSLFSFSVRPCPITPLKYGGCWVLIQSPPLISLPSSRLLLQRYLCFCLLTTTSGRGQVCSPQLHMCLPHISMSIFLYGTIFPSSWRLHCIHLLCTDSAGTLESSICISWYWESW